MYHEVVVIIEKVTGRKKTKSLNIMSNNLAKTRLAKHLQLITY